MIYDTSPKKESNYVSVNFLTGNQRNVSTEFRYTVKQGDGYWTLARYIMEKSGRPFIVQQTSNNKLVAEIADAISTDLAKKSITILNPGDVLILRDVGYYVPRLRINGFVKEDINTNQEKIREDITKENIDFPKEQEKQIVIIQKIYPKIEHGKLGKVNAIVVHQTDTVSAEQVFNSYNVGPDGAHFLIDKEGNIYQTAEPYNADSIGIEIVGKAYKDQKGKEIYENLTKEQQEALTKLLTYLFSKFSLTKSDVYKHPEVSYKNETEAESATW